MLPRLTTLSLCCVSISSIVLFFNWASWFAWGFTGFVAFMLSVRILGSILYQVERLCKDLGRKVGAFADTTGDGRLTCAPTRPRTDLVVHVPLLPMLLCAARGGRGRHLSECKPQVPLLLSSPQAQATLPSAAADRRGGDWTH